MSTNTVEIVTEFDVAERAMLEHEDKPRKKPRGKQPAQRTLEYLRGLGYRVAVVERWNPYARIRQDCFGCIDVLAVRGDETLAVQATSGSNVSARVAKMIVCDALVDMRAAHWTVQVHGWRKNSKGRWQLRVEDLS